MNTGLPTASDLMASASAWMAQAHELLLRLALAA